MGFLKAFLAGRARARLRRLVRAHRALMADGKAAAAHIETTRNLVKEKLHVPGWGGLGSVPADYVRHIEPLIRQRLCARVVLPDLTPELMLGRHRPGHPVAAAIPAAWRRHLAGQGFRIATWRCRAKWLALLASFIGAAALRAVRLAGGSGQGPAAPGTGYAVLLNAPAHALPRRTEAYGTAHGLVRWYREEGLGLPGEDWLWLERPGAAGDWRSHRIEMVRGPLPALDRAGRRLLFLADAARILAVGAAATLLGAWWQAPLMGEALLLAYCRRLDPASLASTYLFNNSSWVLRPLWTYHAEARGSRVVMLFYSTNIQHLCWHDGTVSPVYAGYEIMTWNSYAVWNAEQAAFLRGIGHRDADYHVCGRVDLDDSGEDLPDLPRNAVAVFDVSPFRPATLAQLGLTPPYYTAETVCAFLSDVEEAIRRAGLSMVLKTKRDTGVTFDRKYRHLLARLEHDGTATFSPPAVNMVWLLGKAKAAITLPFSSPAVAAGALGVPSVYYDPTGLVVGLGPGQAESIPVLTGTDALAAWLRTAVLAPAAGLLD